VPRVTYAVHLEQASPRSIAAVQQTTNRQRLSADIGRLLDLVWPVIREQGVTFGHNVVIYYKVIDGEFAIEAGVEIGQDFVETDQVRRAATPAGEVATVAYFGEYSQMESGYAALDRWCADNGRRRAGVSWEVYGDWNDDPAKLRTDIYTLLAD
jgi:effector-binding domain-containing protein